MWPNASTVAHNVFGVAQTINSANYVYMEALQRTLQLGHPKAVDIYTSQSLTNSLGLWKEHPLPQPSWLSYTWDKERISTGGTVIAVPLSRSTCRWSGRVSIIHVYWGKNLGPVNFFLKYDTLETGGLFVLGIALMQLFSENKTYVCWSHDGHMTLHSVTWSRDFIPLVEMLGLYFQIRDDYANLSSDEVRQCLCVV